MDWSFALGLWGTFLSTILALARFLERRPRIDWYVKRITNDPHLCISIKNPRESAIHVRALRTIYPRDGAANVWSRWVDQSRDLAAHLAHMMGSSYEGQVMAKKHKEFLLKLPNNMPFPRLILVEVSFWQGTVLPFRTVPKLIIIPRQRLRAAASDPANLVIGDQANCV